jgi:glycine/D-amino acid oxidase-like deaminating enzyme
MAVTKLNPSGPDGVQPPNSSGITVIIIGLGYAGSVAAVECHRKGHKVIVFEQAPEIKALGKTSRIIPSQAADRNRGRNRHYRKRRGHHFKMGQRKGACSVGTDPL